MVIKDDEDLILDESHMLKVDGISHGDTVLCVNAKGVSWLIEGKTYTVDAINNIGIRVKEHLPFGYWQLGRFVKVAHQLRTGDIVECVKVCCFGDKRIEVGQRDVIIRASDQGLKLRHHIIPPGTYLVPSHFKLFKPHDIRKGDTIRCVTNKGLHATTAKEFLKQGETYTAADVDDWVRLVGNNYGFATWRFDVVKKDERILCHAPVEQMRGAPYLPVAGAPAKVYKHKAVDLTARWPDDRMAAVVALNELVGPRRGR